MSLREVDCAHDVFSVTRPRARKAYNCGECGALIEPGQIYRRDFLVVDGEAETHISCAMCDKLSERFFDAIPEGYQALLSFQYGGLQTAIIELRDEFGVSLEGFEYPPTEQGETG